MHINNVKQIAWSTSAGTFALNGLDMHVSTVPPDEAKESVDPWSPLPGQPQPP